MANETHDRERMRNDLRELAKLAKPDTAAHRFETADSSGYVDLSAFSAKDSSWIERELARARDPEGGPRSRPGDRAIDALAPESMAPVSLTALIAAEAEDTAPVRALRLRRRVTTAFGAAGVACVALLAVALAKHAPPPAQAKTEVPVVQAAPPPPAAVAPVATTAPAGDGAQPSAATVPGAPPAPEPTAAATGAKKKPPARAHAGAPRPSPAARAAATRPVVIPPSRSKSSGDPLMDAMRASVGGAKH
ncbi:MAG TPA: hypothetical protein VIF15_03215 [Polyangiaceae bacterium]|jgi:hypothetical protein